jgi:micrococcal nuclease
MIILVFAIFIFIKYSPNENNDTNMNLSDNYVIEIIDGDTFKLYSGDVVRLICVDSPEKGKEGYDDSKEFLSFLILNKEVRLESDLDDRDAYGRLLRYVYVNDSYSDSENEVFVNKELVTGGYASVFRYGNSTRLCGEIES